MDLPAAVRPVSRLHILYLFNLYKKIAHKMGGGSYLSFLFCTFVMLVIFKGRGFIIVILAYLSYLSYLSY